MARFSLPELVALAEDTGFPDPALAAAIAMAESNGNPAAVGDNGDSLGLWQIDTRYHRDVDASRLTDPTYNAQQALAISGEGSSWRAWSTAWNDAKHLVGYLGASAPFRRYYAAAGASVPSSGSSSGGRLVVAGVLSLVAAWTASELVDAMPRRRRRAFT